MCDIACYKLFDCEFLLIHSRYKTVNSSHWLCYWFTGFALPTEIEFLFIPKRYWSDWRIKNLLHHFISYTRCLTVYTFWYSRKYWFKGFVKAQHVPMVPKDHLHLFILSVERRKKAPFMISSAFSLNHIPQDLFSWDHFYLLRDYIQLLGIISLFPKTFFQYFWLGFITF